jgi:hypothetical protein
MKTIISVDLGSSKLVIMWRIVVKMLGDTIQRELTQLEAVINYPKMEQYKLKFHGPVYPAVVCYDKDSTFFRGGEVLERFNRQLGEGYTSHEKLFKLDNIKYILDRRSPEDKLLGNGDEFKKQHEDIQRMIRLGIIQDELQPAEDFLQFALRHAKKHIGERDINCDSNNVEVGFAVPSGTSSPDVRRYQQMPMRVMRNVGLGDPNNHDPIFITDEIISAAIAMLDENPGVPVSSPYLFPTHEKLTDHYRVTSAS